MTHKAQYESMRTLYRLADDLDVGTGGFDKTAFTARELRLASATLLRISEQECNGIERWDAKAKMRLASWTEEDQTRSEARRAKQEKRVMDALESFFDAETFKRLRVEFQGDPRGAMIIISTDTHGRAAVW